MELAWHQHTQGGSRRVLHHRRLGPRHDDLLGHTLPDKYKSDEEEGELARQQGDVQARDRQFSASSPPCLFAFLFRFERCRALSEPLIVGYFVVYVVPSTWSGDRWAMPYLCAGDKGNDVAGHARNFRNEYTEVWTSQLHLALYVALAELARSACSRS